jgi:hypothetical protein
MVQGLSDQTPACKPCASRLMEGIDLSLTCRRLQSVMQQILKQLMVAIPVMLIVQWDEEQTGAIDLFQQLLAFAQGLAQYDFTQRGAKAIQDRRSQQEFLHLWGQVRQDLGHQIVHKIAVGAPKAPHKRLTVSLGAHGKGRQTQAGDPALGAFFQDSNGPVGQWLPYSCCKECLRFSEREAQVLGSDLGNLTSDSQPSEGQVWLYAAGQYQVHPLQQATYQSLDQLVYSLVLDPVKVVENENK